MKGNLIYDMVNVIHNMIHIDQDTFGIYLKILELWDTCDIFQVYNYIIKKK